MHASNGLDYMLAYNLIWLLDANRSNVSGYRGGNILDFNNSITQAGKGYLLNDVFLASRIASTSSTRAGEVLINSAQEVEMLPGFSVDNGIEVNITTNTFDPESIY